MNKPHHLYRTVFVSSLGIVALAVVAGLAGHWTGITAVYPSFAGGVGFCVGAVAAKSAREHTVKADAAQAAVQS